MFDLFRSREKTVRYVLGFVLGLVALSMVITLIPGYSGLTGGGQTDSQLIAEIGGEPLTILEVRQTITRELRNRNLPKGMESIYIPMMVQQMINERAVAYQATRMGFQVTEQELSETIASLIPQLFEGGKFAGKDVYAAFLAQNNMTIPQFEDNVRKQTLMSRIDVLAAEGVVISPDEVEREFRNQNEKLKVAYFILSPDKLPQPPAPPDQEVRDTYEKTKVNLKTPEKRAYLIYGIDEPTIGVTIKLDPAELRAAYQQATDRYRTPDRVRVRHILLKTTDKPKEEVAKIRARAEDLLKRVKAGGDFAALAKANSEDTGSAVKGGDLDWITRGQTVPEFEKAAFSMKPGEISPLISTMYGFHILKIEAKEDARLRPFEEVKGELEKEVMRGRIFDKMQLVADQIRSALIRSANEAEKIAKEYGITPARVAAAGAGDPLPEVGVNPQFTEAVTGLAKGGVTPVLALGGNKLVVAQVTDIIAPRQSTFEEVQAQVRNQLLSAKRQRVFDDKLNEIDQKLKGGADFAAVAKQVSAEIKTPEAFTQQGSVEGLGGASALSGAFKKNVGEFFGPVNAGGGKAFLKVVEKIPADLTQLAAQRQGLLLTIKAQRSRERREMLFDGIVKELIREKKVKVYEENIRRLTSDYGG